jgi:hypothetical protein
MSENAVETRELQWDFGDVEESGEVVGGGRSWAARRCCGHSQMDDDTEDKGIRERYEEIEPIE